MQKDEGQFIIGVDPHKSSWTAVVIDAGLNRRAAVRVPVTDAGYRKLSRFAARYPNARWALEGAYGLGAPLAALLAADGITVWDVPAKLAARVRTLSTGHGRKSDEADALSVAVAAATTTRLRPVSIDETAAELKLLTEHRDDLVRARTQSVNRLHSAMNLLITGEAPRHLNADTAARLLRRVRAADPLTGTRRLIAVDLNAEVRSLDKRIAQAQKRIVERVESAQTALLRIRGIGHLNAAKILARTGPVGRFRSAAAFAAYAGVAPREVSSGETVRHRLSRTGDRQLNHAIYIAALTQIGSDPAGKAYYERKRAAGKTKKEAIRCLKRRLADVIYRTMLQDERRREAGPAGHRGTTPESSVASSHPQTGASEKSHTRPAKNNPSGPSHAAA